MKILIDMNLSPVWVQKFEGWGINSVHWSNVGDIRATDQTIMTYAANNGYIVFTHDLDFGSLLAATQAESPSVIQVRIQDLLPNAIASVVFAALNQCADELAQGALVTVDVVRSRVRILPLNKSL